MRYKKKDFLSFFLIALTVIVTFAALLAAQADALKYDAVNVTVITSQLKKGKIAITYDNSTPHNQTIYNVSIQPLQGFTFTQIASLDYLTTKNINYTYMATQSLDEQRTGKITYYFLAQATRQPSEKKITINNVKFTPHNTTAYVNDTITWENKDTVNHTVTNLNNLADKAIVEPNKTYSRKFTATAQFEYFDDVTGAGGVIDILRNNITTLVHSPGFDRTIIFNIKARYPGVTIESQVIPEIFTMDYNDEAKGILRLSANDTLHNVVLSGDWFTFRNNSFDLAEDRLIEFSIKPTGITKTEQTGQAYQKQITIDTENGGTVQKTVTINIRQFNFTGAGEKPVIVLQEMTADQFMAYCEERYGSDRKKWSGSCGESIINESYPVEVQRTFYPEITEEDAKNTKEAVQQTKEGVDRVTNQVTDNTEKIQNLDSEVTGMRDDLTSFKDDILNKLNPIGDEVTKKKNDQGLFLASILLLLVILGLSGGGYYLYRRHKASLPDMEM